MYIIKTDSTGSADISENSTMDKNHVQKYSTIFNGPLLLPEGKTWKVFDISGRQVIPDMMRTGIYFIEVDGEVKQKIIKIR
jgi:hypothetical protein